MSKPKRTRCPFSSVYDRRHIKQYGYGCPYKHEAYNWPAVMKGINFIWSYRQFERNPEELYCQDGLHLNFEGTKRLRLCLISNCITLQEKLIDLL
jgi:hypothetical protein